MTTMSAVIPVVPAHIQFLGPLLVELHELPSCFDEIIVVASGFDDTPIHKIGRILPRSTAGTAVIRAPLQSAGANRNLGLSQSNSDLVFFLDADDRYSPHRIKFSVEMLRTYEYDLLLHGFFSFVHGFNPPPFPEPPDDIREIKVATENYLREATLFRTPRNRPSELKGETESTNLLFNDQAEAFEVHHAHAIVRREAVGDIRYHEEFGIRNEDGVFARDMLEAGKKVLLTPFVLSAYRQGARAKPRKPSNFFGWRR